MKALLQKMKSSNIESIGYAAKSKNLYIRFLGGGLYAYYPFSQKNFDRFRKAKSKGKWFHKHIRYSKKYDVQKVDD